MNWDGLFKILMVIFGTISTGYIIYIMFFPSPVPSTDITLEKSLTERQFTDVLEDLRNNSDYSRISGLELKGDSFLSETNIIKRIYPAEEQYIKFKINAIGDIKNPNIKIFLINPQGTITYEFSSDIDIDKIIEARFEISEKKSCVAYGRWQLAIIILDESTDNQRQLIGLFSYPVEVKPSGVPTDWGSTIFGLLMIGVPILLVSLFWTKSRVKSIRIQRTEKDVSRLREEVRTKDFPIIEKPSKETEKKLEELSQKIEKLERFGVSLEPEHYFSRGLNLYAKGQYELALEEYDKVIELAPDHFGAWHNKSAVLCRLERYPDAKVAAEKAIESSPTNGGGWFNRACAYSLEGNKEDALKDLSKSIELNKKFREDAKKDEDFKELWADPDFKKIVS